MKAEDTYAWLMENGGPIIRYRTATELMPPGSVPTVKNLEQELLQSAQVKEWLANLMPPVLLFSEPDDVTPPVYASGIMEIHGGKPTNFENIIGKLSDFGVKNGMRELDQRTLPYRKWLKENVERPTKNVFKQYNKSMVASFLARAGCLDEPGVVFFLRKRLDTVYEFARKGNYDIFVPGKYIRKLPLIKLEITPDGVCLLPLIYDVLGWAAYLPERGTQEDLNKMDTIIKYIFNDEYQQFPWGYGIMQDGSGRTWSLGWSVHLPRYFMKPDNKFMNETIVHKVSLFINFKAARQHKWFEEIMNHLEQFRTEKGTYLFPRGYLPEKPQGYWINGAHMALEENRRLSKAIEVESTFWMAKFHKKLHTTA